MQLALALPQNATQTPPVNSLPTARTVLPKAGPQALKVVDTKPLVHPTETLVSINQDTTLLHTRKPESEGRWMGTVENSALPTYL